MKHFIFHLLGSALSIGLSAFFLSGVSVTTSAAFISAIVLGIANFTIRPILLILTLPINILTLGLFSLVINAIIVLLVAQIVPGFYVDGFWWALIFSVILSIVQLLLPKSLK